MTEGIMYIDQPPCASEHGSVRNFKEGLDVAWIEPCYKATEVNQAARVLVDAPSIVSPEYEQALVVVNNWRASHNFPLNTFQVNLRNAARLIYQPVIVAQRIKRLASITDKLRREENMKLSQMQDIGGCRAVLLDVDQVARLARFYRTKSNIKHRLVNRKDYISAPRDSGYRGVHLIYRYYSDRKAVYNGLKIEMQLRSRQQHAWATAVETVGIFLQQALKSSLGEADWLRFFQLMSSEIARREGTPLVAETPTDPEELRAEITELAHLLGVRDVLRSQQAALQITRSPDMADSHFFLLKLDSLERRIYVNGFTKPQVQAANRAYARAESELIDRPGEAVLVSVDSLRLLRRAYPNYFADTTFFLRLLNETIHPEGSE